MKNLNAASLLETVKVTLAIVAMCCILNTVSAQATLPYNNATQKVCYRFRVPVNAGFSKEQAFEMMKSWVANDADVFTRTNNFFDKAAEANSNNKNFTALEQTFSNVTPLQSIDPASNRLSTRVMVKYQSNNGNRCMQLMYVQYYMVITIKDDAIEAEITDIRYNHFNRNTFGLMRINSWSDYTSCEAISTMEYLAENERCHEEFVAFAMFFNNDVTKLQNQLAAYVVANQLLTLNK